MAAHTPGPWEIAENGLNILSPITDIGTGIPTKINIATITDLAHWTNSDTHANARLIASAPKMANLFSRILEIVESGDDFSSPSHYGTEHQQIRGLLTYIKEGK